MERASVPPYRAVAGDLRAKIESGELLPGEQIPTTARLCEIYGVSKNTALRAVRLLRDEGLVTSEAGWGVFVADR